MDDDKAIKDTVNNAMRTGKAIGSTLKNTGQFAGRTLKNSATTLANGGKLIGNLAMGNWGGAAKSAKGIAKGIGNSVKDTGRFIGNQARITADSLGNSKSGGKQIDDPVSNRNTESSMQQALNTRNLLKNVVNLDKLTKMDSFNKTMSNAKSVAAKNAKRLAMKSTQRIRKEIKKIVIAISSKIAIVIIPVILVVCIIYAIDKAIMKKSDETIGQADITSSVQIVTDEDGEAVYKVDDKVYDDFVKSIEDDEDLQVDAEGATYVDGVEEIVEEMDNDDELQSDVVSGLQEYHSEEDQSDDDQNATSKINNLFINKAMFGNAKKQITASYEIAATDTSTNANGSVSTEKKYSKYLEKMVEAYMYTTLPNLGGNKPNSGMVKVIRRSYNAEDNDRHKGYVDTQSMLNSSSSSSTDEASSTVSTNYNTNTDNEVLMSYMKKEEFDEAVQKLQEGYDEDKYNKIKDKFTITFDAGTTTSGGAGTGATGKYENKDIKYDITLASATKTPSDLGIKSEKATNVRTTVYGPGAGENAGYAGTTCSGIALETGRHIVAVGYSKENRIAQVGDWIYFPNKPELGYFLVADIGDKNARFGKNWLDIFDANSDSAASKYGDYNDIEVIKKEDADNLISKLGSTSDVASATQATSTSSGGTMVLQYAVYDGTKVSVDKIAYQSAVSKYAVPIDFLVAQLQVTRNPQYVAAICDMIMNNSKIELVIQETLTTTTTYKITQNEEKREQETISSTKEVGTMKYIREADTWIVNSLQEYFKNTERQIIEDPHDETSTSWNKTVINKIFYKGTPED